MNINIKMAAWSDNAGRNYNEDNYQLKDNLAKDDWGFITDQLVNLDHKGALLTVCDGMGGMSAGDVASKIAVDTVKECFAPNILTEKVMATPETIMQHIEKTIIAADDNIKKDGKINSEREGMGSTIVLAWIVEQYLYIGWCGDSRAYRFNPEHGLELLSHDHSFVQELVDSGKLAPELAFDHPNSNIITRSLGDLNKKAKPDVKRFTLHNNDIILLCSDGLNGILRDNEIENIIAQNAESMDKCRKALWQEAENAGWDDNVTIALCQIVSGAQNANNKNEPNTPHKNNGSAIITRKKNKKSILFAATIALILGIAITIGIIEAYKWIKEPPISQQSCREEFNTIVDSCYINLKKYRNRDVLLEPFKKEIKEKYEKLDSLCKTSENISDTCKFVNDLSDNYELLENDLRDSFDKWRDSLIKMCKKIKPLNEIKDKLNKNEIITADEENKIIKEHKQAAAHQTNKKGSSSAKTIPEEKETENDVDNEQSETENNETKGLTPIRKDQDQKISVEETDLHALCRPVT